MEHIKKDLEEAYQMLNKFISDDNNLLIKKAGDVLVDAIKNGGKIISCGNGGSMCEAMHFAEEMTGKFRGDRKPLPGIAISDPTHISCTTNDYGWEQVFSRYIEALGNKTDVLLAISTSGNSKNVINGIEASRKKGMKIVGLSGGTGGKMKDICDILICAPESNYADRIQEIHMKIIHALINYIEHNI